MRLPTQIPIGSLAEHLMTRQRSRTVAFVLPTLNRGGAELQAVALAHHLVAEGWRVVFFPLEEGGTLEPDIRGAGFEVECPRAELWRRQWSPTFWLNAGASVWRLARAFRRHKITVAMSFLFWSNPHTILAGALARVRGIVTCRRAMGSYRDQRPHYLFVERLLNRSVDAIIANSRTVAQDTLRRERCDRRKLLVIHNAIEAGRFADAAVDESLRAHPTLGGADCVVVIVANLKPIKRLDVFLRGFASALEKSPGLRGVIVGEDHGERAKLEALAVSLKIADKVLFTGGRPDPAPVLALADVVALTSDAEGFPNSVLEGMAAGRPIVATRAGGVDELVQHAVNGLLVTPGDADGFGEALARLATDPRKRREMGDASRRRASQARFTQGAIARRYAQVFSRVAMGLSPRPQHRAMRILHIIGSLREGGAEGQLVILMRGLRNRGLQPAVMLLRREGIRLPEVEREGFPVLDACIPRFRPRWSPLPWIGLIRSTSTSIRLVRQFRPDVVHAWLFWAHLWAGVLHILGAIRVPLVTSRRQLPVFKAGSRWMNAAENWVNRRCTAIVCNSRAVMEETRHAERNTRGKLLLVHGGIDMAPWESTVPCDLAAEFPALRGVGAVVLCVASYLPCKGHADLLHAWVLVTANHHEARLLCVGGDGGEFTRLHSLALDLGIADRVVLAGPRTDITAITQACDVAVLASHEEGFSNVVLEAMACGKPVVATSVGGNRETVVNGVTGYLVPPRNPEALATALNVLLDSEERRTDFGRSGRERVRSQFPQTRMIDRHAALYRRLGQEGESRATTHG